MIIKAGTGRIETERLILRKYRITDVYDMFHNWCSDPDVCRFYTWEPHKDSDETKSLTAIWIGRYEDPMIFHWIIEEKETGQAIGAIYLDDFDEVEASAVVSYLLGKGFWGKGYATEAVKAVLRYGFEKVGLARVDSHHHERNPASGRVLVKCGFRMIGEKDVVFPECSRIDGKYLFYTISKRDFETAANG